MGILLYILRSNLQVIGVVDTFISLIWKMVVNKAGNFELYAPATPRNRKLLLANRFIVRSDDSSFMYITSVQEKIEEDGPKIIVTGYSSEAVFRKRLYPSMVGHTWISKDGPENIDEVVNAISPLGFNCNFDTISGTPIVDIPESYLSGNMEDYFHYILGRTQTEKEDENGVPYRWYKEAPETYHLYIGETGWYTGPDNQIECFFYVEPLYGESRYTGTDAEGNPIYEPYIPFVPTVMFSEDIGNISDLQYSYSEEDCYSSVLAVVNRDFSKTVTETITKTDSTTGEPYTEETTRNIGFEDLDIEMDDQGNPTLPSVWRGMADDYLGYTEKVIYVDPVITQWTRPEYFISWNKYTDRGLKSDTPYGNTTHEADGRTTRMHERYQTTPNYTIDAKATIHKMETEIDRIISKGTENFQGTFKLDYETFKHGHMGGQLFKVGDIVIVRDNNRMKDYYKRVDEIEEIFDRNGYRVVPTLGEPLKTIWDKL